MKTRSYAEFYERNSLYQVYLDLLIQYPMDFMRQIDTDVVWNNQVSIWFFPESEHLQMSKIFLEEFDLDMVLK